jgi:single-strand DNA-binding protein
LKKLGIFKTKSIFVRLLNRPLFTQRENKYLSTTFRTERNANSITEHTQTPLVAPHSVWILKINHFKMYNRIILVGNLGKDPEIRRLENGTAVGKFTMATSENYRDNNNEWQTLTEWHEIVVWRSLAENAEKVLKKGAMVFVEGKLTHRKYTDKNGIERYTSEIVANTFKTMGTREGGGMREGYLPTQEPPATQPARDIVTPANAANLNSRPQSAPQPQQQRQEPVFEIVPPPTEADAPSGSDDLPF